MIRYYKRIENGKLICIGTGVGGEEITKEEYEALLAEMMAQEPEEPTTDEISAEEALDIILGGEGV